MVWGRGKLHCICPSTMHRNAWQCTHSYIHYTHTLNKNIFLQKFSLCLWDTSYITYTYVFFFFRITYTVVVHSFMCMYLYVECRYMCLHILNRKNRTEAVVFMQKWLKMQPFLKLINVSSRNIYCRWGIFCLHRSFFFIALRCIFTIYYYEYIFLLRVEMHDKKVNFVHIFSVHHVFSAFRRKKNGLL